MKTVSLIIIVAGFLIERLLDFLNIRNWDPQLPAEMKGVFTDEKYRKARDYAQVNYRFGLFSSFTSFILMMVMILSGGFGFVDELAKAFSERSVLQSLFFFALLGAASEVVSLPFDIYKTFVIEQKFGFNKTSVGIFIQDKLKGYVLAGLVGGVLLSVLIFLMEKLGIYFVPAAILFLSAFMLFASMFYTSLILPIFNKLVPLPEGELRAAIEEYSRDNHFPLNDVFIMDGSKRSTKANAFFSGLGRKKTIVLYDTLIQNHTTEELVAVLAHEIGHYRKKHTRSGLIRSVFFLSVMLSVFGLIHGNPLLASVMGSSRSSFHIDILAFSILYSPVSMIMGMAMNVFSRKHEFEADHFAVVTYAGEPLISALKKLSADSLSNLTPHRAYVFFHYSHPPLLKRIEAIRRSA